MFSWPSDLGLFGHDYGEARKGAQASGYDLAGLLREIANTTNIGTVHIVAHSMGAEVLGHAMIKLGVVDMGMVTANRTARPRFRQIVFAAPDVTPRIFEDVIEPAIKTNHMITTYASTKDLALWLSTIKNQQARSGRDPANQRLPECVDTIDVSAVAGSGWAHSTWAESPRVLDDLRIVLRIVLRDGVEPSTRGLKKRRLMGRTIWALQATAPAPTLSGTTSLSPVPMCGKRQAQQRAR